MPQGSHRKETFPHCRLPSLLQPGPPGVGSHGQTLVGKWPHWLVREESLLVRCLWSSAGCVLAWIIFGGLEARLLFFPALLALLLLCGTRVSILNYRENEYVSWEPWWCPSHPRGKAKWRGTVNQLPRCADCKFLGGGPAFPPATAVSDPIHLVPRLPWISWE